MQILYIIGNGFDLNLGLKTSYNDFYKYYLSIKSNNVNVQNLKSHILETYNSWADLELALGAYTQKIEGIEAFDDILIDIGQQLSEYLRIEAEKFESHEVDQQKFFNYLSFPEKSFLPADQEKLLEIKKQWANNKWTIDIYTFNYTLMIEQIIDERLKNTAIATSNFGLPIKLGEIKHIHGYLDKDMVIGVNDISQIKNESFHNNHDILESIVKSDCNRANRNNIDREFTNKIQSANLICIFGSSIGDTDNKWWQLIGERLKGNCSLIIFTKGEEISPRVTHFKARIERKIKDLFLSKTNLTDQQKENVKEKIFIGLNTSMFDGIMKEKD